MRWLRYCCRCCRNVMISINKSNKHQITVLMHADLSHHFKYVMISCQIQDSFRDCCIKPSLFIFDFFPWLVSLHVSICLGNYVLSCMHNLIMLVCFMLFRIHSGSDCNIIGKTQRTPVVLWRSLGLLTCQQQSASSPSTCLSYAVSRLCS